MKTYSKFLLAFMVPAAVTATANAAGAVVAAKDSGISTIDAEEAKKLFLGREPQINGENVVLIFQRQGAPTRDEFESKVLGRTGAELTAYWSKLIFTGKANAPVEVGGDADVKAKVNNTPGAIGYISDGTVDGSVKVLYKY
jgi:ABC-type phosphate transport system substrate-binding protein